MFDIECFVEAAVASKSNGFTLMFDETCDRIVAGLEAKGLLSLEFKFNSGGIGASPLILLFLGGLLSNC